jgi:TIR domain
VEENQKPYTGQISTEASMSLQSPDACKEPEVFISYRRLDNLAPGRNRHGFVNYLLRQVRSRLQENGVPDAVLWQDRSQIEPGDVWSEAIWNALNRAELFVAILSKNYISSSWCAKELHAMKERVEMLGAPAGEHRIFRVDKHKVPDDLVPEALRRIQSVQFYREDPDAKCVDEFFWGGKVRFSKEFDKALLELTSAIGERLEQLGIRLDSKDPLESQFDTARASNGRVVFVAWPAFDMVEYYRTLVEELRGTGFRVTPDPDKDRGSRGEDVRSAVVNALAEAEASIHLLGTRTGGRPDGLDMDLVPMQLAAAAEEAKRKPGFERLIWAPTVLLSETSARARRAGRDPLKILQGFGQQLLEADQIDGDTASRFNDFVLQRLERRRLSPRQLN